MENLELQSALRSLTRGRARIRHEKLRGIDDETRADVESLLLGFEGVTSARINPRVGSLLVTWDEAATSAESLLQSAGFFLAFLGDDAEAPASPQDPRDEDDGRDPTVGSSPGRLAEMKASIRERMAPAVEKIAPAAKTVEKAVAHSGGAALDFLAPLLAPDQKKGGRKRRVAQNRLMLAAYLASIGILGVGAKRLHWVIGAGFTALLGVHLYQHRRVL